MGEREDPAADADLSPIPFTPDERAEFEEWQNLGHHSWQMIDAWESDGSLHQLEGGDVD
jgi:hypothetical protein